MGVDQRFHPLPIGRRAVCLSTLRQMSARRVPRHELTRRLEALGRAVKVGIPKREGQSRVVGDAPATPSLAATLVWLRPLVLAL